MRAHADLSRREFVKSAGALIIYFGLASRLDSQSNRGQFDTQESHVDPKALDSWLAIHADGSVTAYTGKCDFGQGMLTAQTQLVAEELCVPIDRVRLVQCDTAHTPDQGSTSGSQSTPTNFNDKNLALAAATAREALLAMAATQLNENADRLTVTNGVVTSASGKSVRYEQLIGNAQFKLQLNPNAKRKPRDQWTVLGTSVPSLDRVALMTGQFEFVHHVRVPGMVHGRVVRPPQLRARLIDVDLTSVQSVRGLVKVVVRKNFVGVVAETQYGAAQAARLLKTRWEPGPKMPAFGTFFDHLKTQESSPSTEVDSHDVDAQLAAGNNVMRATYSYPFQSHGSLGASCAVADVTDKSATVWSPTQSAYPTRDCVAMLLGMQKDDVRLIYTRGSGCYGLNGADAVTFDAAVLSQEVGRPVRLQYTRHDEMAWENYGSACLVEHRASLNANGEITAWDRESWVPSLGNRPGNNRPGNVISGMLLGYEPAPLRTGGGGGRGGGRGGGEGGSGGQESGELRNGSNTVPNYVESCNTSGCSGTGVVRSARVRVHTVRSPLFTGPLRSPMRIQNTFANECFMDELCRRANADPVEFRLRHLKDARLIGVVKAAAAAAKWTPKRAPDTHPRREGIAAGRGIACVAYEGSNGYAALVADVDVDMASGVVHPRRFVLAIDCGPISNPDGLRNQVEGGILQGMSRSLVEEVTWDERRVTSTDWETYTSLRMDYEIPHIETVFVTPPGVAATGAGETSITVTPAAIGNAVFDATGARLRDVPFTPTRVRAALDARTSGA